MFRYSKLGYVALNVSDAEHTAEFYREHVGLTRSGTGDDGEQFLRCSTDHHNIVLYKSDSPGVKRIGWEMENEDELDNAIAALSDAGLTLNQVPRDECKALHQGRSVRFTEPHSGATFELYSAINQLRGAPFVPTVAKIQRIGHIVVKTPNHEAAVDYYMNTLNFRMSDIISDKVAFLRCFPNPYHHTMGLGNGPRGMHHINFMVSEIDDIGKAIHRLKKAQVAIVHGPGRHPPSGSIFLYFLDPDGMTIEYSFGMEEFPEQKARKAEYLEARSDSFDYWGAVPDPRKSSYGSVEILGPLIEELEAAK
ncbi:MAG: VOC family protein [Marinosulfonomonas sp.]|nr:VOC family protein [Marinosulfonomonas sp.]